METQQTQAVASPILTMDEIFAADDTRYETIPVPTWGGSIRIGSLRAGQMLKWIEANDGPAKRTAGLRLLQESLVDAQGNRIGKPEHIEKLASRDHHTVTELIQRVLEFNKLNVKEDKDKAKNSSGEAGSDASPTASPSTPAE